MELIELLQHLRKRIPWNSIKPILAAHKIPKGTGWAQTIVKILDEVAKDSSLADKFTTELTETFAEHLYCGEKLIQIYNIDKTIAQSLVSGLKKYTPDESEFSEHFPFPIPQEDSLNGPSETSVVKIEFADGICKIVTCTIRSYDEVVHLDPTDLKENVYSDLVLSENSEILIKQRNRRQFYDLITISPDEGVMQVRLDWGLGMRETDSKASLLKLRKFICTFAETIIGAEFELEQPVNLFPLIELIYSDDNIGRVCELGFTVNSGSVKSEKLRRSDTDIRSEEFHKGGREAVSGQVLPYRLAVEWSMRRGDVDEAQPELLLPGRKASLNDPDRNPLNIAIISKCFYESDFLEIYRTILRVIETHEEQRPH